MARVRWEVVLLGVAALVAREAAAVAQIGRGVDPGGRHDHAALVGEGAGEPLRLLLLGDSAVDGYGLPADRSLPRRLAARLADRTGRPVEVRSVAVAGATSADVATRQVPLLAASGDLDAIVVGVGVNDALRGVAATAVEHATRAVVHGVRELAPGAAFAYIPCHDLRAAPGPRPVLRWLLGVRCRAVARRQCAVLAATGVPMAVGSRRDTAQLFGADGLHPGAAGVEVIASHVAGVLGIPATR